MHLHWLLPTVKGVPVLMYHRVLPGVQDGLTVTPEQLRDQWAYLKAKGYQCLSLPEFLSIAAGAKKAPSRALLLTFDDGYASNLDHAYPLLKEFNFCATFFIIGNTVDGTADNVADDSFRKMTANELRQLDPAIVQLSMHGYQHENFSNAGAAKSKAAIESMMTAFKESGLPYHKVLAYPYGARPKLRLEAQLLKAIMQDAGIEAAFRIGNKPERIPATDMYELKRIDIRGEDTLEDFKIKLRKGKLKPF